VHLCEAVAERGAELLLAKVAAGVHRREDQKLGRADDDLGALAAALRQRQRAPGLEHAAAREGERERRRA
jgi:hypothetical protein